jgi:uncharacterized damage-inducible protein DinB
VIEEQWTDESLKEVQSAFGREETNAQILMGLIKHIVHHRGQQVTILMQQESNHLEFMDHQRKVGFL